MSKIICAGVLMTALSLVSVTSGKLCTQDIADETNTSTNVKIMVCCEGYLEVKTTGSNGLECEPICEPPCGHGTCYVPNKCACEEGYRHSKLGTCIPIEGVIATTMTSTDGPIKCRLDYVLDKEGNCQPTCEPPCANGVCYSPNRCACDEGFRHSKVGSCVANETLTIKSMTAVEDSQGSSSTKMINWKWYPLMAFIAVAFDGVLHIVV